jgi:hypothetical protein
MSLGRPVAVGLAAGLLVPVALVVGAAFGVHPVATLVVLVLVIGPISARVSRPTSWHSAFVAGVVAGAFAPLLPFVVALIGTGPGATFGGLLRDIALFVMVPVEISCIVAGGATGLLYYGVAHRKWWRRHPSPEAIANQ